MLHVAPVGPPWWPLLAKERFVLLLRASGTVCHYTSPQQHLYRRFNDEAEADPIPVRPHRRRSQSWFPPNVLVAMFDLWCWSGGRGSIAELSLVCWALCCVLLHNSRSRSIRLVDDGWYDSFDLSWFSFHKCLCNFLYLWHNIIHVLLKFVLLASINRPQNDLLCVRWDFKAY